MFVLLHSIRYLRNTWRVPRQYALHVSRVQVLSSGCSRCAHCIGTESSVSERSRQEQEWSSDGFDELLMLCKTWEIIFDLMAPKYKGDGSDCVCIIFGRTASSIKNVFIYEETRKIFFADFEELRTPCKTREIMFDLVVSKYKGWGSDCALS